MQERLMVVSVTIVEQKNAHWTSNKVVEEFVYTYEGTRGYEVRNIFDKLGEKFAEVMDQ